MFQGFSALLFAPIIIVAKVWMYLAKMPRS